MTPRRREKCLRLCPIAMDHVGRIEAAGEDGEHVDADRAGGMANCPTCGRILLDHPDHPFDTFLTVLCDGSIVKL